MTEKCQSFVRDLNFWPALHTPRQFPQKMQGTNHLLCAFWTTGFTTRPPDIGMDTGSTTCMCTLIFQVSNRTIRCVLKRSVRLYGGCMQPDYMTKYSSPMLTDLTENLIQKHQLFIYWPFPAFTQPFMVYLFLPAQLSSTESSSPRFCSSRTLRWRRIQMQSKFEGL